MLADCNLLYDLFTFNIVNITQDVSKYFAKVLHIRSQERHVHGSQKVSFQVSSKQAVGNVWIAH